MATKRSKVCARSQPTEQDLQPIKPVDHRESLEALLVMRDQGAAPPGEAYTLGETNVPDRKHLDYDEMLTRSRAGESDLEAVRKFAAEYALQVLEEDPRSRTVKLGGHAGNFEEAFDIELIHYHLDRQPIYSHKGEISVPGELGEIVVAVFGLDNRSTARRPADSAEPPPEIDEHTKAPQVFRGLYSFPVNAIGREQCIAILEFAGGFDRDKLNGYLEELGVQAPEVIVKEVGRGKNEPENEANEINADVEIYMDIEIVASVAPGAKIVVYFGENSDKGWVETVNAAIFDTEHRPSVLSISWGKAELDWDPHVVRALEDAFLRAAHLGITICCSSGDFGVYERTYSSKPPQPFTIPFPASSPHVLACGGTRTQTDGDRITHEAVWNESDPPVGRCSGGGVSHIHERPPYQADAGIPLHNMRNPGRGVPDVAANASTRSGFQVFSDETEMSMGGTSAAAPLWAGLVACLNESLGCSIGFLTPLLYTGGAQAKGAIRDIVDGNNRNRMYGEHQGYEARAGWDACTGLGTPRGEALLRWLKN